MSYSKPNWPIWPVSKKKENSTNSTTAATAYNELAAELTEERPSSIPLLSELLQFAKNANKVKDEEDDTKEEVLNHHQYRSNQVEKVYESMKSSTAIDEGTLAQYFGLNQPSEDEMKEDEQAKKEKKDMEEQRKLLRNTLFARASLRGEVAIMTHTTNSTSSTNSTTNSTIIMDAFDEAVKDMKRWVKEGGKDLDDEEDNKTHLPIVLARHARLCQNKKAMAISILLKARKDYTKGSSYKVITNELVKVYESMMEGNTTTMDHLVENAKDDIHTRFPVVKALL